VGAPDSGSNGYVVGESNETIYKLSELFSSARECNDTKYGERKPPLLSLLTFS
jgi:hypothetical protein